MTQITPPPSDDDLPDERELAALYARLPKAEPDASLDAAVLAQAARAMPVSRRPRWPVALASAAVLVLAVGVAWQVRELQPVPASLLAAAPAADAPAAVAARTASAPVAADGLAGKSIAAEAAPTRNSAYVGAASAAKPTVRPRVNHTASPAFAAKMAPPPAPAPVVAPEPITAPAPVAPSEPPFPTSPPAPSAPAPAPEAAIVSAAPASEPQRSEPQQLDLRQPTLQHDEMPRPEPSGMLLQKRVAPVSANTNVPAGLAPDDRVGEIRRLLGSGKRAQALRELKDLRQRYPHYDLPQDLRDLSP